METAYAEQVFPTAPQLPEGAAPTQSRPNFELALTGLLVLIFPASMSTAFGSIGAYVSALVTVIAAVGILRARPSFAEIRALFPSFIAVLIVLSTAVAAMTRQYDWSYLRGTPVQWSALLGVSMLAGLWQIRGGDPARWARCLLWASAAISLIAVYEYVWKDYLELDRFYSWVTGFRFDDSAYRRSADSLRAISTMGNPLALGTVAAISGAGALAFYLRDARLVWFLIFAVNTVAVFASLSRSCWLALVVSALLIVIVYSLKGSPSWVPVALHVLAGCGIMAVIFLYPPWQEAVLTRIENSYAVATSRVTELSDSFSYSHRTSAMSDAMDSLLENPHTLIVGYGLGAENSFFLGNSATPITGVASKDVIFARTFDNSFLTIAYSFGTLGLFWFLRLVAICFRRAMAAGVTPHWYIGMLAAAIVCIYFYNAISTPSASYVLAALLGFRFAPDRDTDDAAS